MAILDRTYQLALACERWSAAHGGFVGMSPSRYFVCLIPFILVAFTLSKSVAQEPVATSAATATPANSPDGTAILAAIEQYTTSAIAKAERSVVAIARVRRNQSPQLRVGDLVPANPLGLEQTPTSPDFVPSHFGSGVIISNDGFIVTCAHVLEDPLQNDYYVWMDKRVYEAKVVSKPAKVYAADPFTDLAVLKIDAQQLTPIAMAKTENLKKGQFVIALGNPYAIARDGQASASWGIVANLNRVAPSEGGEGNALITKESLHQFGTLIQTDAKLNLGTSGGALINLQGEMIGLTTALAATSGYEQSAGFAIAVDDLFLRVIESLKAGKLPEFGFLGIQPEDLHTMELQSGKRGAKVSGVVSGLPGDEAGLRVGDIIAQVNSRSVRNRNDLFRELSQLSAGASAELKVLRSGPGQREPETITLKSSLSKKYVATSRPSYALNGPRKWRGMLVEYATAVPSELTRNGVLGGRRSAAKLAVLAVDPNTPAWQAGIRPGYGILSVDGKAVDSPSAFENMVAGRTDRIGLQIIRLSDRPENLTIASE
jgi:serine protease Do